MVPYLCFLLLKISALSSLTFGASGYYDSQQYALNGPGLRPCLLELSIFPVKAR